jgi:hypothetical protein
LPEHSPSSLKANFKLKGDFGFYVMSRKKSGYKRRMVDSVDVSVDWSSGRRTRAWNLLWERILAEVIRNADK